MQILDDYGICCMIGARGVPRLKTTQLARRTTSCALNGTTMAGKLAWSTILRMSRTAVWFNHSRPAVPSDPRDTDPCRYFWMKVSGRGMAGRGGALNPPTGWEICRINPTNFFLNEGTPEPRPPLSRLMVPRGLTQALVCSKPQTHTKTCVFRVCLHGDPRSAVPHPRTPTPLTLLLARWDVRWAPDWSCCTRSR